MISTSFGTKHNFGEYSRPCSFECVSRKILVSRGILCLDGDNVFPPQQDLSRGHLAGGERGRAYKRRPDLESYGKRNGDAARGPFGT